MSTSSSTPTHPTASPAIAIPTRKTKYIHAASSIGSSSASVSSSTSSMPTNHGHTFGSYRGRYTGASGKAPADSADTDASMAMVMGSPGASGRGSHEMQRRPSLMSATFCAAEYRVVDVGGEECRRLITCVKASQGFDWNQEIFLPSYASHPASDLERRQDPVEDIVLTDEEARSLIPS